MIKIRCDDRCGNTLYIEKFDDDLICIGSAKNGRYKKVPNDIIISRKELIEKLSYEN